MHHCRICYHLLLTWCMYIYIYIYVYIYMFSPSLSLFLSLSFSLSLSLPLYFRLVRWTPKGQLVAHIHEHRDAVNRYSC